MKTKATLVLQDGHQFHGTSFGYERPISGEVVFNTAMMGYPESLTDPSYSGQILVMTFPLVGNYGVPTASEEANGLSSYYESSHIHVRALVVSDYSEQYSHWMANRSLSQWLNEEKIVGIEGIDTRELTKKLREHGVMMGRIVFDCMECDEDVEKYDEINYVDRVSCKEIIRYSAATTSSSKNVVLVDCGVKANIIRCLLRRGVNVTRVPWDFDFNSLDFDALFLANGPGNPDVCKVTVDNIRRFMEAEKLKPIDEIRPVMGICMGNQLLSKAAGATIYKLKYGHRSHNQPVRMVGTETCFVTSQNHGFAVDTRTLSEEWEPLFVNMNDGSNEGIRHKTFPWFSAQFHPEACSGPVDTEFLFDKFVSLLKV